MKTSPEKWDKPLSLVKKIDVSDLKDLKSPSNKRFSDAALSAQLTITTTVNKYESSDFDHGDPPNKIKKLVDELTINFNYILEKLD